ncbi:MAG TPA: alpha-2-macroglobulin family protein, partial [Steroidobacteraceae bacterium]
YKVDWKWWWDKTSDSLARFVQANSNSGVTQDLVETGADGMAKWTLRVNFPAWGRYLVRVCDTEGGHCAGRTFYIDWPSWAGKEREHSGPAANVLAITSDKASYLVGETATIQLPEAAQGRALITLENASETLEARWLEPKQGNTRFTVPITRAMAPNVYVAVTLVQPHEGRTNDRPIRLYGVIALIVTDPQTRLTPVIHAADEWRPESRASVEIAEAQGRAMTYTVAVVDEGLLSLTSFRTPDPHEHFYAREALGISTWDLFDDVVGAYGAELERLLALGGSDAAVQINPEEKRSRFPPVVRFLGPFHLQAGAKVTHEIDVPRYVGAMRVMVVAGEKGAYGSAQKSVFVRQPLMLLPTMPRVIGPGEEVAVPVSVFVSDPAIRDVSLSIEPDAMFTTMGAATTQIAFTRPEEKLGVLRLKAADRIGQGRVRFVASSGAHQAVDEIAIEVRSSNPPTTRMESRALQPGETWQAKIVPHGIPGTHTAVLEVSGIPALDLERRLVDLIYYPHGCLEQITSGAFPQLYLPALMKLEEGRKLQIEAHIRSVIERLRWYQRADGGFSYWPTGSGGFPSRYSLWSTIYASHFLIEAGRAGYALPPGMRENALRHLRFVAQQWSGGYTLEQAYRLYVLALAGEPEVGAMNRLRERRDLSKVERWLLAASYQRAGLEELAATFADSDPMDIAGNYQTPGADDYTLGSGLRDRAIVLHSLVTLGRFERVPQLMRSIAAELSSRNWYSTHAVAFSLMAIARATRGSDTYSYSFEHNVGGSMVKVKADTPMVQLPIPQPDQAGRVVTIRNTSQRVLFVTTSVRGVPKAGEHDEHASDLELQVTYTDDEGRIIDTLDKVEQGTDLIVTVDVRNASGMRIDNIALTQIFPAGWEIHNERLDGAATDGQRRDTPHASWWDGSLHATQPLLEYTDIRDDRVMRYFGLRRGESIRFTTRVNAAYLGRFYLPSVLAEAMYDATKSARTRGQWTEVVSPGR